MVVVNLLVIYLVVLCLKIVYEIRFLCVVQELYVWLRYSWLLLVDEIMADILIIDAPADALELLPYVLILKHRTFLTANEATLFIEQLI